MKITNIEPQKNKDRVNIYVDNVFSIGITNELRFKYKLEVDMEVDDEFIKEVLQAEELNKAINQALKLLSYRQRSEKEMYNELKRKGFEEYYILESIEYCKSNSYIDDRVFAESFVNDKIKLNNLGPERIRYELKSKGISDEIINRVLIFNSSEQYDIALNLAFKKLKTYQNDDKNTVYRKLSAFLQRKGYSYDIISKVMKEILKDW